MTVKHSKRGPGGRFVRADGGYTKQKRRGELPAVERRIKTNMMRNGIRRLHDIDRRLYVAMKKERDALLTEVGGDAAPASARTLADLIVRGRLMLDTIDSLLLELGAGVLNRKKKELYPLAKQRQELADSLARHLSAFAEMKAVGEIERRLDALERGEVGDAART